MSFNINPDEADQRRLQQEKAELELTKKLASARTADFGTTNAENNQQLQQIVSEAQPQPLEIEKMTEQEAEALRLSGKKQNSAIVQQQQKVAGFMGWLGSFVGGLFSGQEKRQTPCDLYGHNVPFGSKWDGPFPRCSSCGIEITTPDMLRGAAPKQR